MQRIKKKNCIYWRRMVVLEKGLQSNRSIVVKDPIINQNNIYVLILRIIKSGFGCWEKE